MLVLFSSGLDIFMTWVLVEVLMEAIDAPAWGNFERGNVSTGTKLPA
jgi:hypothetical protein